MKTLAPWFAVAVLVCVGCSGDSKKSYKKKDAETSSTVNGHVSAEEEKPEAPNKDKGGDDRAAQPRKAVTRKIIYTADLSLIVDDLTKAEEALLELVDRHQGLIAQSSITGSAGSPRQGRWRLRVPVDRMRPFLRAVLKLGVPETNSTDSKDVTGRYYDLEAKLKNYKADEESVRKELAQVVKAEDRRVLRKELLDLRTAIEELEGEYKRLADLTTLTTVNVTFREIKNYVPSEPPPPPSFGSSVSSTFNDSLAALVSFGKGLVLFGAALAPWLPLAAVVVVLPWVTLRRRWKRRPPAKEVPVLPLVGE